ncbi:MAG: hypothetical protein J6X94_03310 [Lachnospiraceae bacterium]|nr:hypothetical protein [Lachnospiraceae bacterium]
MKTDKNKLFRAIGEIDEKYISEILEEDASGMNVIKSFDAAKAATNSKKKASGAKKFFAYYLPAVAGLLVCAVIVKAFMTSSDNAATSAPTAAADSAAPASYEEAASDSSMQTNSVEVYNESETAEEADIQMAEATSDNYGLTDSDKYETLGVTELANPFIDCESLEEACEISGIELNIPDDFSFGFDRIYRAMDGRMIEVIFMEGDEEVYRIRKGLTSELGTDISGDYNEYSVSTNIDSANYAATLSGNEEDKTSLAVWNDDTYSYSVTFEEPVPTVSAIGIIDMIMAQ